MFVLVEVRAALASDDRLRDGGSDDEERLTELLGEPADLTDQPIPSIGDPGGPPAASQSTVVVLAVGGFMMFLPGVLVTLIGLVLVVVAAVLARLRRPRDVVDPETGEITRVAQGA